MAWNLNHREFGGDDGNTSFNPNPLPVFDLTLEPSDPQRSLVVGDAVAFPCTQTFPNPHPASLTQSPFQFQETQLGTGLRCHDNAGDTAMGGITPTTLDCETRVPELDVTPSMSSTPFTDCITTR